MLKCPKCDEPLEAHFSGFPEESADYLEVELVCKYDHWYFIRIKSDDLIEE